MTKQEILTLIKEDIDAALIELDAVFRKDNALYNDFNREYLSQPNNFSLDNFRRRLLRFVSREYEPNEVPRQSSEVDYYEALCELDFKTQTKNFKRIYQYRKIAAFLLHGNSNEYEEDLRWLYNQMLNEKNLLAERHKVIDCAAKVGGTFEVLLEELFMRFNVNSADAENDPTEILIREIEKKLTSGPYVCVIKNAGILLGNETELRKLFENLLNSLDKRVVRTGHRHAFIFLFIDSNASICKKPNDSYFFWYEEEMANTYAQNAEKCKEIRIFDLSPIGKIAEKDIEDWISWNQENKPALYPLVRNLRNCKDLLAKGDKPFLVIKQICATLNIKIEEQWIS